MIRRVVMPLSAIAVIHLGALCAGFFGPYDPSVQDRTLPLAPPTQIHLFDPAGHLQRPYVCLAESTSSQCASRFPIELFPYGRPYRIGPVSARVHLFGVSPPGAIHLMGTDEYGRDQLSRFLYGARVSLAAGILASAFTLLLAVILGGAAGFWGKWVDEVTMATTELFLAMPWLYAMLAVRAFLPLSTDPITSFLTLAVLIGIIGWAGPARIFRGIVLSGREHHYVLAARGFGASGLFILSRHLLPELKTSFLTQAGLLVPRFILAEITLSFLGLGVSEPVPSWGTMLAPLQHYSVLISAWWMWIPAVLLIPVFLAYSALVSALAIC
jgi:peptide/nickel transport system permease protein